MTRRHVEDVLAEVDPTGSSSADLAHGLRVATALGLEPLDSEGGLFRRTYTASGVTAIYYFVAGPDFSAMHRMRTAAELFLFHAGSPLRMLILDSPEGREEILGPDPTLGQRPQLMIAGGIWQGASPTGAWSLISTVVVPGFEWADFELGDQPELAARYPQWAERLDQLCR